jgi:hypothetical protein
MTLPQVRQDFLGQKEGSFHIHLKYLVPSFFRALQNEANVSLIYSWQYPVYSQLITQISCYSKKVTGWLTMESGFQFL